MPQLDLVFDAIICDPPYGTTACAWDTIIPFEPLWENYKRLVKANGAVVLFGSQPFTSKLVMSNLEWFKYEWVWRKNLKVNHLNARRRPMLGHETILIFSGDYGIYNPQRRKRTTEAKAGNKKNGNSRTYGKEKENYSDRQSNWLMPDTVLEFDAVHSSQNRYHPTQKPVALLAYLIRTYTNPGEIILDNTMGSGTTLKMAKELGRRAVGIEISEEYCKIAVDRLRQSSFFSIPDKPKLATPTQKALL
jgi:site-specific DNA-methyltransferase (adenine-specific)